MTIYAVYHGDEIKAVGTKIECLEQMRVKYHYFDCELSKWRKGKSRYDFVIWEE